MMYFYLLPFFCFIYFSALGFYCLVHTKQEKLGSGSVVGFVCVVCAFCQLLGACEVNMMTVHGTHTIVYSKYLEWMLCTPLWCFLILDSYGVDAIGTAQGMIYSISFCVCGFCAALTSRFWIKIWLVIQGCFCCLVVLWILWRVAVHPPRESRVAKINLIMTSLTYPIFTLTWALGPDVFAVTSLRNEFIWESCLSLFLKTIALSYTLTTEEFNHFSEWPSAVFTVARSVLLNMLFNRH